MNAKVGKSYVVFGKINSTAINLSSIAAGTGGFVINGDHSKGFSGRSVAIDNKATRATYDA
jgi:hypothetical protein